MKTPDAILCELEKIPATVDAIAERVRIPMLVADAMLKRHAKDGLATVSTGRPLAVWSLTESGKARAESLQTPCTP